MILQNNFTLNTVKEKHNFQLPRHGLKYLPQSTKPKLMLNKYLCTTAFRVYIGFLMDGKNSKMSINFYKKRVLKEKKIMVQFWCVLIVLWTYICPQHVTCADRFVAPIYIYIYTLNHNISTLWVD